MTRGRIRRLSGYDEVLICLVAPLHYLKNDAEPYPNRISYESLVDFLADGTPRGEYKAAMLRLGISQERRHPKPVKNELVTRFWQSYYQALKDAFPDAVMPYPKLVPVNSDWPVIQFPEFPAKTRLVHKMAQGNLDWETGLPETRLREILSRWNDERMMVAQTGKSFVLRTPVPPLNRMDEFAVQFAKVQEAFAGIQTFRKCIKRDRRMQLTPMENGKEVPHDFPPAVMANCKKREIGKFAEKWTNAFQKKNFRMIEQQMGDDCAALGFVMDCGKMAEEKYPGIRGDCQQLQKVIDSVTDVPLLGSAIYSQWRFYQHWACAPWDESWFLIALKRLKQLCLTANLSQPD